MEGEEGPLPGGLVIPYAIIIILVGMPTLFKNNYYLKFNSNIYIFLEYNKKLKLIVLLVYFGIVLVLRLREYDH